MPPLEKRLQEAATATKTNFWKILSTALLKNQGIFFGKSGRLNRTRVI